MTGQFDRKDVRTPDGLPAQWGQPACELEPGSVHVWLADLDQPAEVLDRLLFFLDDVERARAFRFRFEHLQQRFIAAHGFLRIVLGHYLRMDPALVPFETGQLGKPSVSAAGRRPEVQFNLSHSGSLAILGVGLHVPLGIDIEQMRSEVDIQQLAAQFFAPEEARALLELPPGLQRAGFYACWTRKEAYIKATGRGLSQPLDGFTVNLKPGEAARFLRIADDPAAVDRWNLMDLPVPAGYRGALAILDQQVQLHFFVFPASLGD